MNGTTRHSDWLNLMEVSGPFLAEPVLDRAFPQGLDELDPIKRKTLRQAYDEWREALDLGDAQFPELHRAWIELVLKKGLELDEDGKGETLSSAARLPETTSSRLPEYGITLKPDYAVVDDRHEDKPMMLIRIHNPDVKLDEPIRDDGWATTPADRMAHLCRATKTRLGLITDGERWMLVDAPEGGITTYASWYSRLWGQEPVTLQSFIALLGIRRFFVDSSEQLPALFDESLKHQYEVTESLGEQVRRAVEVLIQALDRADVDRNRELLHGVEPAELYEAGLTVMMRLVFLLCAEERDLLLLGDERYEADYAISTLRMQLRGESDEILERRWDAWSRLLSVFRAVYGGIDHETLRMPALGGSLFDPDRFPFLEGRAKDTNWRLDEAKPLPIDNRTVLLLLEAIQMHRGRALSYRALDVEQIGYVYEGLLERTAVRAKEVTLDLDATKNADKPWVSLGEVESAKLDCVETLEELFRERTGSTISRVRNDLKKTIDESAAERLLTACHGDQILRDRIRPYFHLLRTDRWGYPLVYPKGAFMVTTGSGRRETGTHYTPKSLTEAIVTETLVPVVYVGPAEGKPREEWVLKSPEELLDLKVCDPAMGSGAFLVQACRWLAERLVEAWGQAEQEGKAVGVEGEVIEDIGKREPLVKDAEGRSIVARRLIAERCLYGVDINPLAVELAKLSIWLVTLSKGRPFGFLDHNLRCGDSLLGIHRLDQLTELSMAPSGKGQQRLFGKSIEQAVREAIDLRQQLRAMPIRDIRDIESMTRLDADARCRLGVSERIADALIGATFSNDGGELVLEATIAMLAIQAEKAIGGDYRSLSVLIASAASSLTERSSIQLRIRRPFHWPLEFPEVFAKTVGGFDAVIGNPPFLWALRISIRISIEYSHYLKRNWPHSKKNADLCSYFFLRAHSVLRDSGCFGLIATNTISEADTRETSLDYLVNRGCIIYSAITNFIWPGSANVRVSALCIAKSEWKGVVRLDGESVSSITTSLESGHQASPPLPLKRNKGKCFKGSVPLGDGFFLTEEEVSTLLSQSSEYEKVIFRYINGEELNESPRQEPGRWVIYFSDWSLEECEKYPLALDIVRERVKPVRDKIIPTNGMARQRRDLWWKFTGPTVDLYTAIDGLDQVLVGSAVSKHHALAFVPSNYIFSNALNVFAVSDFQTFTLLQSTLHSAWAVAHGSRLENRPRYNVSDCFETFPFPENVGNLTDVGLEYYQHRQQMMLQRNEGLTKIYNRMHDVSDYSPDVSLFRRLHEGLDIAVATTFCFTDIKLDHGFYKTKSGLRFTLSNQTRRSILDRLLELNHQRYKDEVAQGLHGGSTSSRRPSERTESTAQPSFDFDTAPSSALGVDFGTTIHDWLRANPGWHGKEAILAGAGVPNSHWKTIIYTLLADGSVERQGEKRGVRYRVKTD